MLAFKQNAKAVPTPISKKQSVMCPFPRSHTPTLRPLLLVSSSSWPILKEPHPHTPTPPPWKQFVMQRYSQGATPLSIGPFVMEAVPRAPQATRPSVPIPTSYMWSCTPVSRSYTLQYPSLLDAVCNGLLSHEAIFFRINFSLLGLITHLK